MRAILLASAVLLSACGGAASGGPDEGDPNATIEVSMVPVMPEGHDGATGMTDWSDPQVARVYLLDVMGGPSMVIVVHELMHAMGLHDHEAGTDCWLNAAPDAGELMRPWTGEPPHLCPSELSRLQASAVPTVVHVLDADLRPVVYSAVAFLNDQVGRDVYLIP